MGRKRASQSEEWWKLHSAEEPEERRSALITLQMEDSYDHTQQSPGLLFGQPCRAVSGTVHYVGLSEKLCPASFLWYKAAAKTCVTTACVTTLTTPSCLQLRVDPSRLSAE